MSAYTIAMTIVTKYVVMVVLQCTLVKFETINNVQAWKAAKAI